VKTQPVRAFIGVSLFLSAGMAGAQTAPDSQSKSKDDLAEIVVTGTLIRGEAPAGANMIEMTQAAVQATGATTTDQLLENIPQLGSFNSLQAPNHD
jgi:iron complex outermembrane recepter protein